VLIEHNIAGDIDMPTIRIKALVAFVKRAIAKEDTLCGAES